VSDRKRVLVCGDDSGNKLEIIASFNEAKQAYAWLKSMAADPGIYTVVSQLVAGVEVQSTTVHEVTASGGTRFVHRTPRTKREDTHEGSMS
jgi:hypothetical protein